MLTITTDDFNRNWEVALCGEGTHTNGSISGRVVYDDEEYVVLKLVR